MALVCPSCGAQNDDAADMCFTCGRGLLGLTQGTVIGARYEILEPLGKGGMGMVYKAHDRDLDEMVALKVLRGELAQSAEMAKRFRSEIKLARKVRHRNVCAIHEYGQDGSRQFIAMEYIEGIDLKQELRRRGGLPPDEAYDVAIQLAEGLQAVHDVGVIHRDLKTPNIMRDKRGVLRLMDFGIAKQYGALTAGATATGQIVGTPEYMSPEQCRGEQIDGRSDIYALGIVIYEIFNGDVPFRGDTPLATLFKHLQDPPPLEVQAARVCPPALLPILRKLLAKAPDERYASAREVAQALRAARAALPPQPSGPPTLRPLRTATAPKPTTMPEPETTPLPTPIPTSVPTRATTRATTPLPRAGAIPPEAAIRPETPRTAPPMAPARSHRGALWAIAAGLAGVGVVVGTLLLLQARGATTTATLPPQASAPVPAPAPATTLPAMPPSTTTMAPPRSTPARAVLLVPTPPPPITRPSPEVQASTPPPTTLPAVELPGLLQLAIRPYADVSVDGKAVGTTPMKPLTLPPGVHTVVLVNPGFQPLTKKVTIVSGKTATIDVDLTFEAFPK